MTTEDDCWQDSSFLLQEGTVSMKYLSLCIPTNGIIEWVFPVLDAIYDQNVDPALWEVIVTDNGDNAEFFERMTKYAANHANLIYKKTDAFLFENQIEALRLASGEYLKFMNHRSLLEPGAILWLIQLVKETLNEKPVMYLSNGALKYRERQIYDSFDNFVRGLREFASWTTGVGVWKSDFEKIPEDWKYNRISPHSDVLFWERHRDKYLIDDKVWSHDIDSSHVKKGKYDLYRAFGCEEITVTLNLFNDRDISADTLKHVMKAYEKCLAGFYLEFNILHRSCSYDLNGFNDAMGIFLNKRRVLLRAYAGILKAIAVKVYHKLFKG